MAVSSTRKSISSQINSKQVIHSTVRLILLLCACVLQAMTGHCATLQWVASDPAAGPPAVSYRAYSAVVGPPATAIWTVFDNTSTTNLVIVGNVYRMFRVTGISATGAESLPSNVVTNDFAVPGAPTNATIRASIEGAPTPGGPWAEATNMTMVVAMTPAAQFFRTRMAIAIP